MSNVLHAKLFSPITAALVLAAMMASAQEVRPKVAIKTFQNPANASRSTIGDGLTDVLTTELQNTGKFDVLERSAVDELTKEMDFGDSEYAKSATFAKKGNMLGAQYLLMGKVTNFSYQEQAEREQKVNLFGPNTLETVYHQQADVRVDFRLIDVATGETILSQAGEASKTNTSKVSELQIWYGFLRGPASITVEGSSSLIGRATTEAVKDIVRKLNSLSETVRERGATASLSAVLESLGTSKGQIAAEEGGGLWIVSGMGTANGLQKGDRLRLTHENIVKDKNGKPVYRKTIEMGSMEVTDVSQTDHAEVRFLPNAAAGASTPQVNDIVMVDMNYARSLRNGAAHPATTSDGGMPSVANSAGNEQMARLLKRADSYMTDRFWTQALDEFKRAAAINPNDPGALQGMAMAHYMMGDFIEGDESAGKLLQMGSSLTVPVAHYHPMGVCTGELTIKRGKLAFVSTNNKDETFAAMPDSVEVRKISAGIYGKRKNPCLARVEHRSSGLEQQREKISTCSIWIFKAAESEWQKLGICISHG